MFVGVCFDLSELLRYSARPLQTCGVNGVSRIILMDVDAPRTQAGTRLRRFTLTLNNYTIDEYHDFCAALTELCTWAVLGKEVGGEGTPHLQGAGVLKTQKSFSTLRACFPRAHLEPMKGSPQQNLEYCTKEDTSAFQVGSLPGQGKRTDLHLVSDLVNAGANLKEIAEAHPTSVIKFSKGIMILRSIKAGRRDPSCPPSVYWLFGPTGSGKTRTAFSYGCTHYGEDETLIMPDCTLKWFDAYDGQKCVIFDDFRSKGVTFSFLLRVLDRYPCQVPIKGAFVNWNPQCIFITTPFDVTSTFSTRAEKIPEDILQLKRRITRVVQFPLPNQQSFEQCLEPLNAFNILMGSDSGRSSLESAVAVDSRPALTRQNATVGLQQCVVCLDLCEELNQRQICRSCQ